MSELIQPTGITPGGWFAGGWYEEPGWFGATLGVGQPDIVMVIQPEAMPAATGYGTAVLHQILYARSLSYKTTVGYPHLLKEAYRLVCSGITSREHFGIPGLIATRILQTSGWSSSSLGLPSFRLYVLPAPANLQTGWFVNPWFAVNSCGWFIGDECSANVIGFPNVTPAVQPDGIEPVSISGLPIVVLGDPKLHPLGFTTTELGVPRLFVGVIFVDPIGIATVSFCGTPHLKQRLQPAGIASNLLIGIPKVYRGAVLLTPLPFHRTLSLGRVALVRQLDLSYDLCCMVSRRSPYRPLKPRDLLRLSFPGQ